MKTKIKIICETTCSNCEKIVNKWLDIHSCNIEVVDMQYETTWSKVTSSISYSVMIHYKEKPYF